MKYYIEITLIEEEKINFFDLWSKVFTQIHLGLVAIQDSQKQSPIGISFPEYFMEEKFGIIGSKLRIFSSNEPDLSNLNAPKLLSRLSDYIHISGIREVPQNIGGYAIYNRHQPKVNKERLARRYAKRHNVDYNSALDHYKDMNEKSIKYPFIKLKSLSSNQEFCLWIKKTLVDKSNDQKFSTYGLSGTSTAPEF